MKKDSDLKPKKYNIGVDGLSYFVIKPLIKELLHIPFVLLRIVRAKSLEPFFVSLRELRFTFDPNSRCSVCGRKVKQKWIPIIEYISYPDMDETLGILFGVKPAKPFDPMYVGCKYCNPLISATSVYGNIIAEEYDRELDRWETYHTDESLDLNKLPKKRNNNTKTH